VKEFLNLLFSGDVEKIALAISFLLILAGASASSHVFNEWLIRNLFGMKQKADTGITPVSNLPDDNLSDSHLLKAWRTHDSAPAPLRLARKQTLVRLNEVKQALVNQKGSARIAKISSNLLNGGQYVIGGLLASSFVQESLSPRSVGVLGVLVLIASLFKQQFHPELNAEDARKKASKLQALVRSSEDQLAILDAKIANGEDHSDAMIELLSGITRRLTEIENPEALESA
jgi:hypothetical protein